MGGYSVPMLLQRCVSILLLPVYTHFLRPKDYGVLDLLDLFGNVVAALVGLRLGQGLFYFYFHADGKEDRSRFVTSALMGSISVACLTATATFFAAPALSGLVLGDVSYAALFRIFAIGFSASLPVEFGFCYLRVADRPRAFTAIAILRLIASLCLNIIFLTVFHLGAASILWSSVIVNLSLAALMAGIILKNNPLRVGRRHFIELIRYTVPLGVSSLGELGLHFGDRLFLRPNVSLSLLGIYGLAYKIGMLVSFASSPFFIYWNAQMVGIVKSGNGERLYRQTATYLFLGLGYIALLVIVFAHPALTIAAAPDYRPAAELIPWIALAYVVRGMGSYFLNTFLLVKRSSEFARITWIGTATCMAFYAVLIPHFKLWGAVTATMVGFSTILVVALWRSERARPFHYEYGRLLKIALALTIVVVLFEILRPQTLWLQIAAGSAAAMAFPVILVLLGFPNDQEQRVLTKAWNMLIARGRSAVTAGQCSS